MDFSMKSELSNLWALATHNFLEHGYLFDPLVPNPMMRGALEREPSAFLGRRGSETSQTRSSSRTSHGPYKDSGAAVFFFFFFLLFKFFLFLKNEKWWIRFFLLKKAHFICIGKNKHPPPPSPPSPPPFFSIKFSSSFWPPKKHLCWKTIKKIQAFFLSKGYTQFFTFSQLNILQWKY